MQVWKRRVVVLVAGVVGSGGLLMSNASAQTPPDFPTFPSIPGFSLPTFTVPTIPPPTMPPSTSVTTTPPPTMPPPTSSTTTPPPTMPPSTSITIPPPTMPPTTIEARDVLKDIFEDILDALDNGSGLYDDLRATLDELIADFGG